MGSWPPLPDWNRDSVLPNTTKELLAQPNGTRPRKVISWWLVLLIAVPVIVLEASIGLGADLWEILAAFATSEADLSEVLADLSDETE